MNEDNLMCMLWGVEQLPNTSQHDCHAKQYGFKGGAHPKNRIEEDLEKTLIKGARWVLRACEPMHDGSACKTCEYQNLRGLLRYYEYIDS